MKKGRRILRKLLSIKMLLIYIILIAVGITLSLYLIDTLKPVENDANLTNIAFVKEEFVKAPEREFESGYQQKPGIWIAQNDNLVLYFNEMTTILTVYVIEDDALDGTNETHNGKSYPKVDITKCKQYYRSAQGTSGKSASNFYIEYANSKTGKLMNEPYYSMDNSAQYLNTFTDSREQHYYTRNIEDGIQILYHIGTFNAGKDYLPTRYLATVYRPDPLAYRNETDYNDACDIWLLLMEKLGVSNASSYLYPYDEDKLETSITKDSFKDESYQKIMKALGNTFEERWRGNTEIITTTRAIPSGTDAFGEHITDGKEVLYTGGLKVYTREAFLWISAKLEELYGLVNPDNDRDITIPELSEVRIDTNTQAVYWQIANVPTEFYTTKFNEYFNNLEETPLTCNKYAIGDPYTKLLSSVAYSYAGENLNENDSQAFKYKCYIRNDGINGVTLGYAYNLLYESKQYEGAGGTKYYINSEEDGGLIPYMVGGFYERNESGDFVRDDANEIKRKLYNLEVAAEDNSLVGFISETSLAIFQIGLQFKLVDNSLDVAVINESIVDSSNASDDDLPISDNDGSLVRISNRNDLYIISDISVLPYFTYVDNSKAAPADIETGQIIVPDGSGAIINFDNGKTEINAVAVNTNYYGSDLTFTSKVTPEDTLDLMLGMYGFVYTTPTNPRAVLSVIEKGGNQISLYAHTINGVSQAFFTGVLRAHEDVKIGAYSSKSEFTKWAKNLCNADLQFKYIFLGADKADYVSIAQEYRDYLIKRDNIVAKDNTKNTVVDISFLGAFEEYKLFLGFKYKSPASLTTFAQAQHIIQELKDGVDVTVDGVTTKKNVNNFNVSYEAWTNEEMEYQVGGSIKVSKVLGGAKSMREFAEYLKTINTDFYPELNVTKTKKYDYSYGSLKYTSRSVANALALRYQFNVATMRQDKKLSPTYMINPSYYETIAKEVDNKISKINLPSENAGYYAIDLGNLSANNYTKDREVYGQSALEYQKETLEYLSQNHKLKIKGAYDYAFKYASFITDVPLTSTTRAIYDETIPLYQLVISGLVDYTTEAINGTSSKSSSWFYAKALETGSNLSFVISAENPTVLLNTDYTNYYKSYYDNWKEIIVSYAYDIDQLGINGGRLVYHENVAKNIARVKYLLEDNTYIELIVNTTGGDYQLDPTTTVKAYSAVKVN